MKNSVVHNLWGFCKIRFQCYSPKFKWNQVVLLLKRSRRLALSSFKLSFKYYLRKPQKLGLIYLWKIVFFTSFCRFRKIRFQYHSPQFKWNQVVLLPKRSRRLALSSFKLSLKYHFRKPQKLGLIYSWKIVLFKIFRDLAKYVSNATVHSSNGIKSFFYSNDKSDFFDIVWTFVLLLFLDTIKIRIDLLVKNSVVYNFLRITQNTFPMLQSTVQMESSRSSTQTIRATSFDIVWTFVLVPFLDTNKIRIDLLVKNSVFKNFFADSSKYVSNATVHSSIGIKSFFYSNDQDDYFSHRLNFRFSAISRYSKN